MSRGWIVGSVAIAGAGTIGFYIWPDIGRALRLLSDPAAIARTILVSGAWGMLILVSMLIFQVFLAMIPGQPLMIAAGYIYGFWGGTLLTWLALVAGGELAFWLARQFGRPLVSRLVSPAILARWDYLAARQGVGFFTVSLFLPFFPNDVMCYVAGLGEISYLRFLIANALGRLVATMALTFIGAYGVQLPRAVWLGLLLLILAYLAIQMALRFRRSLRRQATLQETK